METFPNTPEVSIAASACPQEATRLAMAKVLVCAPYLSWPGHVPNAGVSDESVNFLRRHEKIYIRTSNGRSFGRSLGGLAELDYVTT